MMMMMMMMTSTSHFLCIVYPVVFIRLSGTEAIWQLFRILLRYFTMLTKKKRKGSKYVVVNMTQMPNPQTEKCPSLKPWVQFFKWIQVVWYISPSQPDAMTARHFSLSADLMLGDWLAQYLSLQPHSNVSLKQKVQIGQFSIQHSVKNLKITCWVQEEYLNSPTFVPNLSRVNNQKFSNTIWISSDTQRGLVLCVPSCTHLIYLLSSTLLKLCLHRYLHKF